MLGQFFTWWVRELRAMVPGLRAQSANDGGAFTATLGVDGVTLHPSTRAPRSGDTLLSMAPPVDGARPSLSDKERRRLNASQIAISIDASDVLKRDVNLPAAAAENLRDTLFVQMDQLTPFGADDVVFGYTIADRGSRDKSMRVNLAVVKRQAVKAVTQPLADSGVRIDLSKASVVPGDGIYSLVLARSDPAPKSWFNGIIWAVNVLLLAGLAAWPIYEGRAALAALGAEVKAARTQAATAAALRDEVDVLTAKIAALDQLHGKGPHMVALLEEVSVRLPDTAWLQKLEVKNDQVVLGGVSTEAASLVAILEASPFLEGVRFGAALTGVRGGESEQFVLQAQLVTPPAETNK